MSPGDGAGGRGAALEVVSAGAMLARAGTILPGEGNLSVRLDQSSCVITPAGADKGRLAARDLIRLPLVGGDVPDGTSTEAALHLVVYRRFSAVRAIVHAHPFQVLALAERRRLPECTLLLEGVEVIGSVAWVDATPPRSRALAEAVSRGLETAPACVLHRHGAVTVGATMAEAVVRLLLLERLAALTASTPG